jgi:hypothetical protein
VSGVRRAVFKVCARGMMDGGDGSHAGRLRTLTHDVLPGADSLEWGCGWVARWGRLVHGVGQRVAEGGGVVGVHGGRRCWAGQRGTVNGARNTLAG